MRPISEFTAIRNRDFLYECRRHMGFDPATGYRLNINEIIEYAVHSPAPSYYLSFGYAYKMVGRFLQDPERYAGRKSVRFDAIRELAERCTDLRERFPSLTLSAALTRILTLGRASRYFISPATARRIYYSTNHLRTNN